MDEGAWIKKTKWMKKLHEKITHPCKNDMFSLGYQKGIYFLQTNTLPIRYLQGI